MVKRKRKEEEEYQPPPGIKRPKNAKSSGPTKRGRDICKLAVQIAEKGKKKTGRLTQAKFKLKKKKKKQKTSLFGGKKQREKLERLNINAGGRKKRVQRPRSTVQTRRMKMDMPGRTAENAIEIPDSDEDASPDFQKDFVASQIHGSLDSNTFHNGIIRISQNTFELQASVKTLNRVIRWSKEQVQVVFRYDTLESGEDRRYFVMKLDPQCGSQFLNSSKNHTHHYLLMRVKVGDFKLMLKWLEKHRLGTTGEDMSKVKELSSEKFLGIKEKLQFQDLRRSRRRRGKVDPQDSQEHVLTFPKVGRGLICLKKCDLRRLITEEYMNDSLMDFYMKYLEVEEWDKEANQKYLALNSFFYKKIATGNIEGWTKRLDLFQYEYLFIPVCEKSHWTLIIVFNPTPGTIENCEPVTIYHCDSLGTGGSNSRRQTTKVWNFLQKEWFTRKNKKHRDWTETTRAENVVQLKVPKQQNSVDCGLFVMELVKQTVDRGGIDVDKLQEVKKWFRPEKATQKRLDIKKIIEKLAERPISDPNVAKSNKG